MSVRAWGALAAIAAVVVLAVLLGRAPERPGGPAGSSYATAPDGLAAYATLLERDGHPVRRVLSPLDERPPRRGETIMVVNGRPLPAAQRAALERFARGGGRVVLVGAAVAPHPGAAVAVGDGSFLANRRLAQDGNAARALRLAGPAGQPVAFVETVHGYGGRRGLGALPAALRTCLWILAAAALVGLVAYGRRLGPPEDAARPLAPARRLHVDALAAALARARDRDGVVSTIRDAARETVIRRAALGPEADDAAFVAAARRLGLDEREAASLATGADADLVTAGRALAQLTTEGR